MQVVGRALSPFVLRLSKDGRRFRANEGSWCESLTTNGTGTQAPHRTCPMTQGRMEA